MRWPGFKGTDHMLVPSASVTYGTKIAALHRTGYWFSAYVLQAGKGGYHACKGTRSIATLYGDFAVSSMIW